MVEHVKLEIAIQIMAEKISDIYKEIEQTSDIQKRLQLEIKLEEAFAEKEKIAMGNRESIEQILRERGKK